MKLRNRRWLVALLVYAATAFEPSARAFPHVAQKDENLAQLAELYYGDSKRETVLAMANSLDAYGGSVVKPGMRLEVPAPAYIRSRTGDTWPDLAKAWLGSSERAAWLSRANGYKPWIAPSAGLEIRIPAVITHLATEGESILTLHKKFEGEIEHAWELNGYNDREGTELRPGEVVLIPLLNLALTPRGRSDARAASQAAMGDFGDEVYAGQQANELQLPQLLADLNAGRYLEVLRRGVAMTEGSPLSKRQAEQIYRALMEAYAAVDARGAAAGACEHWMAVTDETTLDPRLFSPKIMRACLLSRE